MRLLVQRSLESSVSVSETCVGQISKGLVVFVGFTHGDSISDIIYCVQKLINLRIFEDENAKVNRSILDCGGSVLSISQFTLYANCEKGNRPSFVEALSFKEAELLYDAWNQELSKYVKVASGRFGADMKVSITNDGPVTILIESRKKHD